MVVSINGGTSKSSMLIGFSLIKHPVIGVPPSMETTILDFSCWTFAMFWSKKTRPSASTGRCPLLMERRRTRSLWCSSSTYRAGLVRGNLVQLGILNGLPSGKPTKNYGKSPFYSWVNPLCLWPFSVAYILHWLVGGAITILKNDNYGNNLQKLELSLMNGLNANHLHPSLEFSSLQLWWYEI